MLCNSPVLLDLSNSSLARKTYSRPDNKSADDLKKRLLETAEKRIRIDPGHTWAIQVKGRLVSTNDLVAEEALLHKRCSPNFSRGSSFNTDGAGGRKQDGFRLELFEEFCTWLKTELEHSLFTLEQIHQKMISGKVTCVFEKTLAKYANRQISREKCTLLDKSDGLMYCALKI